jgi:flagellar M-ring protein FliF
VAITLEGFVTQWGGLWREMSASRKVALVGVTVGVMVAFIALIVISGKPSYRVLFSNLSQEDAALIVEQLKERKVPHKLAGGGSIVQVPEDKVHELRLTFATEGIPKGGGVGFEIFDRKAFGATEFIQRVNLQRAIQGELARTIRQFPQVAQARVHISLPEQSLFVRESEDPTATVVLQLKSGAPLQASQLEGIAHLVSSGVQGMPSQNVHIVDTTGKVLYSPKDGQATGAVSSTMVELQGEMEKRLETKILGILEPIVGPQKVVARVNVDLDSRKVEETEETFDPDKTAVRSEQRTTEKSRGRSQQAVGVPGVRSNMEGGTQAGADAGAGTSMQRENETINYEVNRLTRRTILPVGDIRRLTVSVLVDGVQRKIVADDGKETMSVVPRSQEEIGEYEQIIKQAVGFDPQRGDQIRVASAPFHEAHIAKDIPPADWSQDIGLWVSSPMFRYGVILILSFLFLLFVVRPLVKGVLSVLEPEPIAPAAPEGLPRPDGEALERPTAALPEAVKNLPDELEEAAEDDPRRFASAIRALLGQET